MGAFDHVIAISKHYQQRKEPVPLRRSRIEEAIAELAKVRAARDGTSVAVASADLLNTKDGAALYYAYTHALPDEEPTQNGEAELERLAATLQRQHPDLTRAQAWDRALQLRPDLYTP